MNTASLRALSASDLSDIEEFLKAPTLAAIPAPSASPASISFLPATTVGSNVTRTVTLTNSSGAVKLIVSGASVSGGPVFGISTNTCGTVNASGTCQVTVSFQPGSAATFNGTLTISHNASGGSTTIPVTGTGQAPAGAVVLSAATLNLATVVGTPATASVMLTNQTAANITLNTITFSGTAAADYSRDAASTCSASANVAAGANCTLVVRFAPTTTVPTDRPATLTFTHSGPGSPQGVTLQGTVTATPQGVLETGAASLAFPDTPIASAASLSVTLRNTGGAALQFISFTIGGAQSSDFERSGTCDPASPLAIGADCTLTATFRPSAAGSRAGSLTIAHNGANPSAVITLGGNGTSVSAPGPVASFDPAAGLDFGAQTVGSPSTPRTLRLTNSGAAALTVATVIVEGAAFSNVSAASCPASLAPAASCEIRVQFTPTAAGASFTGAVRITTNAPGSPQVVPLSGSGTLLPVPALEWAPTVTRLDFGEVSVGEISPAQSITLRNAGRGEVTLSAISISGVDSSMFSAAGDPADSAACRAGRVLPAGDSCTVAVRFAPGASGPRGARLQVTSNGSAPPPLTLAGTGLAGQMPAMSLAPTAVTLANTRVGSVSAPAEVSIKSAGSGRLRVNSIAIAGPFAVVSKDCPISPFTLAAGATCAVTVTFAPQVEGAANGTLTVVSDASPGGQVVPLSAHGDAKAADGGGGCSMSDGRSPMDPTLWTLALLAVVALYARRGRAGHRAAPTGPRRS